LSRASRRKRRGFPAAFAVALAVTALWASPASARPFALGFADSEFGAPSPERSTWLHRAKASNANIVSINALWAGIAPHKPANPGSPGDPAYDFSSLDGPIRDAKAAGLQVVVQINRAPRWAEGKHRPGLGAAPAGTWKPRPKALGNFARAIARRYSGSFKPLPVGAALPRVRFWQVWGEPNLFTNLNPQFEKRNGHAHAFAAAHYRKMLNQAYKGLKSVHHSNFVVTGGTGPFGDPFKGGLRTPPVRFWRQVFCLDNKLHKRCSGRAKLDALAHDPYSVGGPHRAARNRDDATIPDIWKLKRVVKAAAAHNRIRPRHGTKFWVTEVSWDSRPPDPDGVSLKKQARYLAETFYLLWKQGVRDVLWFNIRDQAKGGSYASTYQSGVYFRGGKAKPSQHAFRFPFFVKSKKSGVGVWGRAPVAGRVKIQKRRHGGWHTLARERTGGSHVFHGKLGRHAGGRLRAQIGGKTSLVVKPR
jgi:hypothetical protein